MNRKEMTLIGSFIACVFLVIAFFVCAYGTGSSLYHGDFLQCSKFFLGVVLNIGGIIFIIENQE